MSRRIDCVCCTQALSKLIGSFKFVHCCLGKRSRKDQSAGRFYNVLDHFSRKRSVLVKFIVYFGKMITKQENKQELANL